MAKIAPSLMCADLLEMKKDISAMERADVDLYHIDIMDGHFVPNLTFGFDFIRSLKSVTVRPLDVHLMVTNPEAYIDKLAGIGVERLSFHIEAGHTPIRMIQEIRNRNMQAGVALNPATGLDTLTHLTDRLDFIHLMGVEPGFAGQTFIPWMLEKIRRLNELRREKSLSFEIEIDGGIDWENARLCADAGADILIAGALCIFDGKIDLERASRKFKTLVS